MNTQITRDMRIIRLAEFLCRVEGLPSYMLTLQSLETAREIIEAKERKEKTQCPNGTLRSGV